MVVYTGAPRPTQVATALDAGASGVLSKARPAAPSSRPSSASTGASGSSTTAAAPSRCRGRAPTLGLTARQSEVVALLLQGLSNAEIAEALVVDVNTVKTHLRHVYKALGVRSRSQVLALLLPGEEFSRR